MKSKPVIARERANLDIDSAIDYYLGEDAEQAALGFIDALERAYAHIGRFPATGATRYAHELNLPGLRTWPLTRYPFLIFYVERGDHIDVWRVLRGQRDIPAWMTAEVGTNGAPK
ncbi:type II toxin-antitoxin system RelE/ParE family toxin (plasmid) [Variovorax sp. V213]|uniref:type II toxin-antitoxin system RelE/ParE family toxin n=1 Tax=Variovorax sp. V213 TaxID=3065955 RepID=UPI0034E88425